jgi:hypothetical protein
MEVDSARSDVSPLPREEYVEQAHLFEVLGARMRENIPAQEILESLREEILVTTKLPMAVDFMLAELRHLGAFASAMERLPHYFTPFQAFVMAEAWVWRFCDARRPIAPKGRRGRDSSFINSRSSVAIGWATIMVSKQWLKTRPSTKHGEFGS